MLKKTIVISRIIITFILFLLLYHHNIYSQSTRWVRNYHVNNYTSGISVKLDKSENVYVLTGTGKVSYINEDIVLIKYDSSGTEQWTAVYNGTGNNDDNGAALYIDSEDYIYITGRSINTNNEFETITIKYNPDGTQQWISKHAVSGFHCEPKAITVDNGSVYITGFKKDNIGSAGNSFFTVKYAGNGNEDWAAVSTFGTEDNEEPVGIKTDNLQNVFVAGWTGNPKHGSADYLTAKYDSNGKLIWSKSYNGPGYGNDELTALDVDKFGNSYITGFSRNDSNKYDYTTMKYNTDGYLLWTKRYNSGIGASYALDLKIDYSGNIIVTGETWGGSTYLSDFAIIKYTSEGDLLWSSVYSKKGSYEDATNIAIDNKDNIYITGGNSTSDYLSVKYDSSGAQQWVLSYDRSGGTDRSASITVSSSGSIYLTGFTSDSGNKDITTIKYSNEADEKQKEFLLK